VIIVGSRDSGSAIVARRNEDYEWVGVDDAGMMRLVFLMIVIHAKMHVLKWRHVQRHEERQASLHCNDATHRPGLYMRRQTFVAITVSDTPWAPGPALSRLVSGLHTHRQRNQLLADAKWSTT
jgi:hypothetical protein